MDKDTKDLLLSIQSEVRQINNRLDEIQKTAANGNYTYTDKDINSNQYEV